MKSEEGVRVIACFWRRVEPVLGGDKVGLGGGRRATAEVCHQFELAPQNKRQTPCFDLSGPVQQTVR